MSLSSPPKPFQRKPSQLNLSPFNPNPLSVSIDKLREQFPALQCQNMGHTPIYFDGPGGAQQPISVIESYGNYLKQGNTNLGGHFSVSRKTGELVDTCRMKAAALFGADKKEEIVFGANMTSMTFHFSRAISQDWNEGDEIILSTADHGSNRSSWVMAARDKGVKVHYIPILDNTCKLDLEAYAGLLNDKTRLVAVTAASNLTGTIVDIDKVTRLAKANGSVVFIDAVHLLPHKIMDVASLGADFVAGSAYKFFGPHLGVFYGRHAALEHYSPYKVEPAPSCSPNCWETGTLNFEALSAFSSTIDYLASLGSGTGLREKLISGYNNIGQYENQLAEKFLTHLNAFPSIELFGEPNVNNRTATFALRFGKLHPADVASYLGEQEIYTWSGHLYADKLTDALKITQQGGVLRVGLMHYNTEKEIERFFSALETIL
ncbi:cysteine desulfurase-like protein [Vibrio sp. AND4]|uniref:cysteine desulfurase-like protein n=1 Tax=Vibrio sp. AND4 TaxID=314289 RepID=UPI00015EFA7F|nr:cysteine desulfurase-like protein [Vibrio sp. AND4]EDP60252.1 putative cysteine desulfurase [Vibrio sp. AND4]